MRRVVVPANHVGPPTMGHGGYVGGFLAREIDGPSQVTLRKPTPVDTELDIVASDGRWELRHGDELLVEAEASVLELDVPPLPDLDAARAAEADSPSRWEGHGVHPTCLGCGLARGDDEGLEIAVGPLEVAGRQLVAATWTPADRLAGDDGVVDAQWVLAALDCPGAMAFIARGQRAGLLGRIVFEQFAPVRAGVEHVVSGWQIAADGRKMFAGTSVSTGEGEVLAAARATWFGFG